jgi:hypothetical protein
MPAQRATGRTKIDHALSEPGDRRQHLDGAIVDACSISEVDVCPS